MCIEIFIGLSLIHNIFVFAIALFFTIEVIEIKQGMIFDSLDEVYQYYNNDVLKIVNIKQIIFYSDIYKIQPDWIGKSIYDGKLIAYYGKERTKECWERWKRYDTN